MAASNKRPRPVEFDEESDEELGSVKIPAVKEFAVRIFAVLRRDNFTKQKFRDLMLEAGYSVTEPTFRRWIKDYDNTGVVGTPQKLSGRKVKLSPYQVDVLAGRVFWCNDRGIKVSAKDYITACAQIFNIHIGETTALRYLKKSGITSHTLQKCSIAKQYNGPELAKML